MFKQWSIVLCLFCHTTVSFACQDNQAKVVKSSSKLYQVGDCLTTRDRIHLASKEVLVLQAFKNGKEYKGPQKLVGPYDDEESIKKKLETFIKKIIFLAQQRAMGEEASVWQIDLEQDRRFCFDPSKKILSFWRAKADETLQLTITRDKEYEWNWLVGEHEFQWPAEMPIQTDQEYRFRINDQPEKTLTLYFLPPDLPSLQQATWMSDKECSRQATILF